jgi:hypothetical protein
MAGAGMAPCYTRRGGLRSVGKSRCASSRPALRHRGRTYRTCRPGRCHSRCRQCRSGLRENLQVPVSHFSANGQLLVYEHVMFEAQRPLTHFRPLQSES